MNTQEKLEADDPGHGVKRYAFDATRGEMFEVASGAYVSVDDLAAANARAEKAERDCEFVTERCWQERKKLRERAEDAEQELAARKEAWAATRREAAERVGNAESEAAELRSRLEAAERERDEWRSARDDHEQRWLSATTRAERAESEAAELRARLEAAERAYQVAEDNRYVALLRAEKAENALKEAPLKRLQRAESEATALRAELAAANARAEAAEREMVVVYERLSASQSEAAALRAEVKALTAQNHRLVGRIDELKADECTESESEAGDLRLLWHRAFRAWRRAEKENDELRAEVERLRALVKTRTEAEQAVLDAMAAIPDEDLEWTIELHADAPSTPVVGACRAELTLRDLKP